MNNLGNNVYIYKFYPYFKTLNSGNGTNGYHTGGGKSKCAFYESNLVIDKSIPIGIALINLEEIFIEEILYE